MGVKITNPLLFILLGLNICLATKLTPEQETSLRNFIVALINCRDNVGISIALARDGEVVFTEGFGYRDLNQGDLMTNDTKINIGSQTKSFTATLAADAVAKGLVAWETPLKDILGSSFALHDEFRTVQANLKDILGHKLGMPSYWGASTAALNFSREELCTSRLQYFTELHEFRYEWLYSNYPYVLAGYTTEVLTGMTWEEHVTNLFVDLGMNDTRHAASLSSTDWDSNTAYSYILTEDGYQQNDEQAQLPFMMEIAPAGGIFSTANDMGKYLLFHLNEGKNMDGEAVIPASIFDDQYRANYAYPSSNWISVPDYPVDDTIFAYGLGWYLGTYRGRNKVYHTGSYSSYNCRMALLRNEEVGVWACVNSPGDGRGSTAVQLANYYALDLLLNLEPWLNETTACTFPDPWSLQTSVDVSEDIQNPACFNEHEEDIKRVSKLARQNSAYVGEYEHPGLGNFRVYEDESYNLRCEFGLLLRGLLNESYVTDKFYLALDPPLDYRAVFFPEYPDGYPTYFITDPSEPLATGIYVPYLEFNLPPIFTRVGLNATEGLK